MLSIVLCVKFIKWNFSCWTVYVTLRISMILYKTFLLGVGGLNLNCCPVIIQLLSFFMHVVSKFILSLCFVVLCAWFLSLSLSLSLSLNLSFVCICHSVCAFYCVMRWIKIYIYYACQRERSLLLCVRYFCLSVCLSVCRVLCVVCLSLWLIGTVRAQPGTVISRAWVQSPDRAE